MSDLGQASIAHGREIRQHYAVSISSLGYYPNPLAADARTAQAATGHLYRLIDAAATLGIGTVTTFVGRDKNRTIDEQWPRFLETW